MPLFIDTLIVIFLLYHLILGWRHGLMGALLGPLALAIGSLAAAAYYVNSRNIVNTLVIGVAGPVVIHFVFIVMRNLRRAREEDEREYISVVSRLLGSFISFSWQGAIVGMALILVIMAPGQQFTWIKPVQRTVQETITYQWIQRRFRLPHQTGSLDFGRITQTLQDPEKIKAIQSTPEFENLMTDENIKRLIEDEETRKMIEQQDIMGLINHPYMQDILNDPQTIDKVMKLNETLFSAPSPQ